MTLLPPVRELGDAPAVSVAGAGLTYAELRGAAAAVAAEIAGAQRVAVWAESTLETIVASVAVLESGLALVPVNPKLGRSELEHVLTDSAPDVILGAPDRPARRRRRAAVDLSARGGDLPEPRRGRRGPGADRLHERHDRPPQGRRAPAPLRGSNLDALADAWDWTGEDVLTHGLPLFHVHGLVVGVFGPLRRGGELRHLGRF